MDSAEECVPERLRMVREQIAGRGIRNQRVLEALQHVPRHRFVPPEYRDLAYTDGPLPIGKNQTISQPYIVGLMSEMLCLQGAETVLEVGTGSGYQAAILACLAKQVHTVERHADLADRASMLLKSLGYDNVEVHIGDGSKGLADHAPYAGIIVTACAPRVPQTLLDQLAREGRLVIPVGGGLGQTLEVWTRLEHGYDCEQVLPVAFVPLRGEFGWQDER